MRKHASRIAAAPASAIRDSLDAVERLRETDEVCELEAEAEKLDELLGQHASFARKSALRETLENVGVAVLVALGLRSCFYEPFKIPSSSMMPTLRTGDHIFVNKFRYGVQVPFTSTVVGQSLGHPARGDVIVFRYPLDPSEDFIKRVIGLPGDEVRVRGSSVAIKRAEDDAFEQLQRRAVEEPCYDDAYEEVVPGCQLFEETLDGQTYRVRYLSSSSSRPDFDLGARTIRVPEGHLLVMGDNRNQSHDSLQWTVRVEAVDAARVLRDKDLRDLTAETLFTQTQPEEPGAPLHDRVTWQATHRSPAHDLSLSVWRRPQLGAEAMWEALAARVDAPVAADANSVRTEGARGSIDRLQVGRTDDAWHAVALLAASEAVLELRCGRSVCVDTQGLGTRLATVVAAFEADPEQASRALLERPQGVQYGARWTGRSTVRDRYLEQEFRAGRSTVRLQVFRKPKQSVDVLQDAALRAVGSSAAEASRASSIGERAWVVADETAFTTVVADAERNMLVVLRCPVAACSHRAQAADLAAIVLDRIPAAASDRRQLEALLRPDDIDAVTKPRRGSRTGRGGWSETRTPPLPRNPFDRVRLEATVQGESRSLELEVWHEPESGLAAKVAEVADPLDLQASQAVETGGRAGASDDAYTHVFAVPSSQTVLRVTCRRGLCASEAAALALARRAAQRAQDPSAFIDPEAERPQPFVPRGHVKGRADVIWLPFERFWLPVR